MRMLIAQSFVQGSLGALSWVWFGLHSVSKINQFTGSTGNELLKTVNDREGDHAYEEQIDTVKLDQRPISSNVAGEAVIFSSVLVAPCTGFKSQVSPPVAILL